MISGTTILLAQLGFPTEVFKAPMIFNSYFQDAGIDAAITPFLAAAQERGCEIQVGTDMLFEQIPAYLEFCGFPSTTPDRLRALAQIKY